MPDGPRTPEHMRPTHGPQDEGLPKRTLREELAAGKLADVANDLRENHPVTRRALIGTTLLSGAVLSVGAALGLKKAFHHEPAPEAAPAPEKLLNDITYLTRDPESSQLEFLDASEGHVAQSLNATFIGARTDENPGAKIIVRKEHHVSDDADKMEALTESEINGRDIKVIRVGATGPQGNNDTHEDPYYCFTTMKDGSPAYVYEWLVLVKKTDNPDKPYSYVDGYGNRSETPWFVGPKFVDTTGPQDSDNATS